MAESHSEMAVRLLEGWTNGNLSNTVEEIQSYTKIHCMLIVLHLANIMGESNRQSLIRVLRNRAGDEPILE